ncbi:hypothetical protein Micbo1qcDRAFT_208396 [Microdochium bolleyi]|uniref:F-box domain-containing protein n=1 Tax=Microdochium bolleyi TaxID=196109 RepID=A0A136IRP5_9PEZI|nr:hypothetical protein Micbo1qcDRAFT_208396 [Microdochium bolleyi]
MQNQLPQEIVDQVIAHIVGGEECESLCLHESNQLNDNPRRDLWYKLVHAEFRPKSSSRCKIGEPGETLLAPVLSSHDVCNLRKLRLVSRTWERSAREILRRHSVLTVDFDEPSSFSSGTKLCTSDEGHRGLSTAIPQNILILAGDTHVRPFKRLYIYDDEFDGQVTRENEHELLSNYRDIAESPDPDVPEDWPPAHLRPEHIVVSEEEQVPTITGEIARSNTQKNELFQKFLHAYKMAVETPCLDGHSHAKTTLTVKFPAATSWFDTYDEHSAGCYDLSAVDSMLEIMRQELFSPPTPQVGNGGNLICANLVELRLELPSTRSFGRLLPQSYAHDETNNSQRAPPVAALFPNLRSLFVAITDATGPGGCASYVGDEYGYNDMDLAALDGDNTDPYWSGYPPSNLQLREPNRDHQRDMWRFVASCRTLESLCVTATHHLRLDDLWEVIKVERETIYGGDQGHFRRDGDRGRVARDWTKTGLEILGLHRIDTSVEALVSMFKPEQHSSVDRSPLRRLNLSRVKILDSPRPDDSWADVFKALLPATCPDLEFVGIDYLSYWSSHRSFDRAGRVSEDVATIWTGDEADKHAMRALVQASPRLKVQGLGDFWCSGEYAEAELLCE